MNSSRTTAARTRTPGRPTLDDSLARRETLLTVAFQEFLAHGFAAANIDAIARKAGVGRATVYRQFGSKEELFRAATSKRTASLGADLSVLVASKRAPRAVLLDIIEHIYAAFTATELLATARMAIAEAHRFPDVCASLWTTETETVITPIASFLSRLKAEKRMDIGDPTEAAYHLITLACGGFRFLITTPPSDAASRKRWARSVLNLLLPALRPTEHAMA